LEGQNEYLPGLGWEHPEADGIEAFIYSQGQYKSEADLEFGESGGGYRYVREAYGDYRISYSDMGDERSTYAILPDGTYILLKYKKRQR
jgi:hypothetical protein